MEYNVENGNYDRMMQFPFINQHYNHRNNNNKKYIINPYADRAMYPEKNHIPNYKLIKYQHQNPTSKVHTNIESWLFNFLHFTKITT